MGNKYVDTAAIVQVIGCVFNNPSLLDNEQYHITEEDFTEEFHKIVFGSIYRLYNLGAKEITLESIFDYLNDKPKYKSIYTVNKGDEYLTKVSKTSNELSFGYYYGRVKKFSLLRAYDKFGLDVSFLYDADNILDMKKKQLQEDWLDSTSLEEIVQSIDVKIEEIKSRYLENLNSTTAQAGEGAEDLIDRLKATPEIGVPLYGPLINTLVRGARLKKFYLRSAPTGIGKTRGMIADACFIACNRLYDSQYGWMKNGTQEPTLLISTEQEVEELQTMMLAFLANVNEEHILNGEYIGDEEHRVREAAKILRESPLYIEILPDFSLKDIESVIRKHIREHSIKYVFHDYIHTSLKILEEITRRSGGIKLREDNILLMISIRFKDIANQEGIFIMSATQLNSDYQDSKTPDQNLLRGAKAIADKIDMGSILLGVKETDLAALNQVLESGLFEKPTIKMSVYKNRRGKYKGVYLWCKSDLGTCRIEPMFMTSWNFEMISIDDIRVLVKEESVFED